jgi:hypothetical protein
MGRGRFGGGRGRGWRYGYQATGLPGWARYGSWRVEQPMDVVSNEQQSLALEVKALQGQLDAINRKLDNLCQEGKDL